MLRLVVFLGIELKKILPSLKEIFVLYIYTIHADTLFFHISCSMYISIYIYIERERERPICSRLHSSPRNSKIAAIKGFFLIACNEAVEENKRK
jgi:hypothetical protein